MADNTLKNDRFLRALACEPVDRPPIWIMRQAGRYLPEYRAIRQQVPDFMTLCKTPELACEVTMQPLARYPFDAAILFSDILTIPDAMGLGLEFVADAGPQFKHPLRDAKSIERLAIPDPELSISYVPETIRLIKKTLQGKVPLLGFSGSPWTLACYMVEGKGSRDFQLTKKMLYQAPTLLHQLLAKLTGAIILYCKAQVAAGVDALMLFDTWGGILSTQAYQAFSLHYMQKIISAIPDVPVIVFTKGGGLWLETIANSGCQGIGLDWTIELSAARQRVPKNIALQGNLDPMILFAEPEQIMQEAKRLLKQMHDRNGYIFNLGHGILPTIPPEHVHALVETIVNYQSLK